MTASLHHQRVSDENASPVKWMLMLHGIFGSGRNWSDVARELVRHRPDWGVVLVDLPEHGRSTGLKSIEPTLEGAAEALHCLVEKQALDVAGVLGHSFGGKVALRYAETADRLEQAWIADASPGAAESAGEGWWMLNVVRDLPGPFEKREHAVAALMEAGASRPVADWMAMNLKRKAKGGMVWRFDIDRIERLLRDSYQADLWDVVECDTDGLRLEFIKAEASNVLDDAVCERIEAAAASNSRIHLHRIPGGHWLNAESPDAVVDLLADRLVVC